MLVYNTPQVDNRTRDRLNILQYEIDYISDLVSVLYEEGHMKDGSFVRVGDVLSTSFSLATGQSILDALPQSASLKATKRAVYQILGGLNAAGTVDNE